MSATPRPDLHRQLARLKDFQRDTVEHVFNRLYGGTTPARRFLVADEVGLGKTLVAGGVVAKVIDHLWESDRRIDVVYICSNTGIARQNINRLNVVGADAATLPSRITLLPKVVHDLASRRVNLISLTPQTSFDLRSSMGRAEERALLFWMLPDPWRTSENALLNAFQGGSDRDGFRARVKKARQEKFDPSLGDSFRARLEGQPALKDSLDELCDRFRYARAELPEEDRERQREVVGDLRLQLAKSCLGTLEPDLIILDEFQRFKHLLDGADPAAALARDLFAFEDVRVLLLSATPYRMYTTAADTEGDNHYQDFLQTIRFLAGQDAEVDRLGKLLADYRTELMRPAPRPEVIEQSKGTLQDSLRRFVVRTERLAVTSDRNGMLQEISPAALHLQPGDVQTYVAIEKVASALGEPGVMEHWKSAPYLLNFMDHYDLKRRFEETVGKRADDKLEVAMAQASKALLSWEDVERYAALDPGNARLRSLTADTIGGGPWQLLWIPPSLPYYTLGAPFDNPAAAKLTKRLVFSSWQVVPKVVAALLSYEAERLMFGAASASDARPNTPEAREKRPPLLRFGRTGERLTGLPLLALLYPSATLAEQIDPLATRADHGEDGTLPAAEGVLARAMTKIEALLGDLRQPEATTGAVDERWYWAAPILLDLHHHAKETRSWLDRRDLAALWRGADQQGEQDKDNEPREETEAIDLWAEHVEQARRLVDQDGGLGPPPRDLSRVLAQMALGGPATVAFRALSRIAGAKTASCEATLRDHAARVGWSFRTLFNHQDVTAMIRARTPAEPYWLRVLEYCVSGCLQSVIDEYAHVLFELEGVASRKPGDRVAAVGARMAEVLQLRTAMVGVDDIGLDQSSKRVTSAKRRMRARFAARFSASQTEDGAGAVRLDEVRWAFNSPFWPFVLCSTSVGQEGLDFHPYCHAVVHWNLPSNPVDLEQREGRVHRYKGHAVRKNLARLQGWRLSPPTNADPWTQMFSQEDDSKPAGSSDLVPFWVLPTDGGAHIERHVLALPLSRDSARAHRLRKDLAVYRMAFGQARQEDLVQYLSQHIPAQDIPGVSERLRIDLAPPRAPALPIPASSEPAAPEHGEDGNDDDGTAVDAFPPAVSAEDVRSVLDRYRALLDASPTPSAAPYRQLLDEYARIVSG